MKKSILLAALLAVVMQPLKADEGMWLPALISQRIEDMQAKGLKLSAEDIYSVNQASLKDAVVLFGSGCTGELVSDQGLLFTNHHCGYGYIQKHSSVEHDYLKDGFWALNRREELPNPGLTVRFLERMEDVTAQVLKGYKPGKMDELDRIKIVRKNSEKLKEQAVKDGKGLKASVEALYYGNQYFLFVFREYTDVRLVGAPPSSIGKFGGETDNWMWPRHTGDFSIFRIYAGKDNLPADYSEDNIPYTPKKSLKISRAGVKEGDFTFVYGCPGSTQEYVHSEAVKYISEVSDPEKIALRTTRLQIMKKYMDKSQAVRIQYSSKYAGVANAWKKWQGEAKGLKKMKTVATKQAYEARFREWAQGTEYKDVLDNLAYIYQERNALYRAYEYYNETVRSIERLRMVSGRPFEMKDYYQPIDEETFVALMEAFDKNLDDAYKPAYFLQKRAEYDSMEAWKDDVFASDEEARALSDALDAFYRGPIVSKVRSLNESLQLVYRDYMRAQMAFEPEKAFYPDANLTLRVAYGHVEGYRPADAIYYHPVSTLRGIIEKDNPDIFDYNIPQTLRDIYARGGHEDQPVCFLATNHTTGGNSGSPVLNAEGNLIGINFDRVWEGTLSDLAFDPDVCRNISLDVRYILFIIKEIGHADYLLDEMAFVD
ncbi:MAG: S46 family peptidase [Candidatus Cryptobacteroides sp.]|nr:S46 family peptidase [Candidatus Cryptobacteroides sp.]